MKNSLIALLFTLLAACGGSGDDDTFEIEAPAAPTASTELMVPIGFQSINDFGNVQIDGDYFAYTLRQKGTLTLSDFNDNNTDPSQRFAHLNVTGLTAPVLCFRSTESIQPRMVLSGQPGNLTASISLLNITLTPGAVTEWYVFDIPRNIPDTGPGLSVYRADGSVAYNSSMKPMRIHSVLQVPDVLSVPPSGGSAPELSVNLPASNPKVAVCLSQSRSYFGAYPMFPGYWSNNMDYVTLTSTGFFNVSMYTITPTGIAVPITGVTQGKGGTVLVVDVTGY